MKRILFFSCLIWFPYSVFSQFSISGKVFDSQTKIPLAGTGISVENTFIVNASRDDGSFVIKNLKKGNYNLKFSYIGYQSQTESFELSSDKELTIYLSPANLLTEEVVILANKASSNTPTTFKNINRAELQKTNLGQDLPFLINTVPSVVTTSDAGAGFGYTGIRIRGTDITRINVTINGVPLNDPESQGVFWVDVPDLTSSIDQIQIQRGVGTSTNGPASFGASISIQTMKLISDKYLETSHSFGSFNSIKNNVSFGTGLIDGKWSFDGRLSKITSDGYIDRSSSDLSSYFLNGSYHSKKTIFGINIFSGNEQTYQAWNGVPSDSLSTNRTFNSCGLFYDIAGHAHYYKNQTDNYKQDNYQFVFSHQISPKLIINATLHYTYGYGYYESYFEKQAFANYGLPDVVIGTDSIRQTNLIRRDIMSNNFYGLVYSLNYQNKKLNFILGGAANEYDGDHFGNIIWAEYFPSVSNQNKWYDNTGIKKDFNIFGKANYMITKKLTLYLDLQYRYVDYRIKGIHENLADISQQHTNNFFNPKAGLFYKLNESQDMYFSYAIANREPTRADYRDADAGKIPASESLQDYELGYSIKKTNFIIASSLFYMQYNNQLVLTGKINNEGAAIMTNVPKSYRTGIELTWAVNFLKKFKWEGNLTLSENKIINFTEYVDNWDSGNQSIKYLGNTDLSFSPAVTGASIISYAPVKKLNISLVSKYVGKQYIDNTSSDVRELNPYLVNNIIIYYKLTTKFIREIGISLMLNNIFDVKYEANAWVYRYFESGQEKKMDGYYPQAGFNFLVGLNLKF
jgi:iron complex outermembrane recepter protein